MKIIDEMKKAVKIIIKGSVQGVLFRGYIKDGAENLGLKGFVRNLEDSNVEVFVEGDIDNVDKMFEHCKKGPKHAEVKEVIITEEPFQDFKEFKVLHI